MAPITTVFFLICSSFDLLTRPQFLAIHVSAVLESSSSNHGTFNKIWICPHGC
ncbi:hypothetical protein MANES_07G100506v8 [Manihot esculenta]|uniref:Uncharacterized protein n=1 Tax=Manihot esculenta TaxID=3983 RepID=A0ACB7HF92_MANES|nr:hypothetical protein MANES_07G100506v8 [Manihot esculenta]